MNEIENELIRVLVNNGIHLQNAVNQYAHMIQKQTQRADGATQLAGDRLKVIEDSMGYLSSLVESALRQMSKRELKLERDLRAAQKKLRPTRK